MSGFSYQDFDLFRFEWARDKHGYELVVDGAVPSGFYGRALLRPKGGPLEFYRPFQEHPGLFRRFASIGERSDPSLSLSSIAIDDEVIKFANEFGLLTYLPERSDDNNDQETGEDIVDWMVQISEIKGIIKEIDVGNIWGAAERFNDWSDNEKRWVSWDLLAAIKISSNKENRKMHLNVMPISLLSCICLQLASEITNNIRYKKCRLCPNWFAIGPGTGHKTTKEFCCTRCRVAWNRQKARQFNGQIEERRKEKK